MSFYADFLQVGMRNRKKVFPDVFPGRDYEPLNQFSSLEDWKRVAYITMTQQWILAMLLESKRIEIRNHAFPEKWEDKPVLIKASKEPLTLKEVKGYMNTAGVRDNYREYGFLASKLYNYGWFEELLKSLSDRYLMVAIFSRHPDPDIDYSKWMNIGRTEKRNKIWYIRNMTPLKGYQGYKFPKSAGAGGKQMICQLPTSVAVRNMFIEYTQVTLLPLAVLTKNSNKKL